jgi:hypothetical protein
MSIPMTITDHSAPLLHLRETMNPEMKRPDPIQASPSGHQDLTLSVRNPSPAYTPYTGYYTIHTHTRY